ncbi:MAG: GNAT family N-acetyltransferase [Ferruginibacter sp.]
MLHCERTDSDNKNFQDLVVLLDQDLAVRDGDEHDFYQQFNGIVQLKNVVVCFDDEKAVGCGAFKPFDDDSVEIKRMFVLPEERGKGIASAVLQELEKWAGELGYSNYVLETGKKQPEAIALYHKNGYTVIANYGQYEGVANSVCMKKTAVQ